MGLFDCIASFQLESLNSYWIDSVWEQDFTSEKELPDDYLAEFANDDLQNLMDQLCELIREWLDEQSNNSDPEVGQSRTWQALVNAEINHRGLLAVIASFMRANYKELTERESRILALTAARLYFIICAIPGAKVYKILNPILLGQAIEMFKIINFLSNEAPLTLKRGKRKNTENQDTPELGNENNGAQFLSEEEIAELIKFVIDALDDFGYFLNNFQSQTNQDVLHQIVYAMVSIIKHEKSNPYVLTVNPRPNSLIALVQKAYKVLFTLCLPDHGDTSKTVLIILKNLLPELIINENDLNSFTGKPRAILREHILSFVFQLMEKFNVQASACVEILVQQLCIKNPDKADLRTKGAQVIVGILKKLPFSIYTSCVSWILSLCHADNVKNRNTGLEIVAKLLGLDEREDDSSEEFMTGEASTSGGSKNNADQSGGTENEFSDGINHKLLLAAVLSRWVDIAPSIRSRALSIFAPLILSRNIIMSNIMLDIFVSPYSNLEVIDSVITTEAPLFTFKTYFEKMTDKRKWPTNVLPGGTIIMELVEKLINDDKIFVRKAALLVLVNICRLNAKWMTSERIETFVKYCKDMSVIARKQMSQCLTDLLFENPSSTTLQKAWVEGVVPLIADNEVKSQEKVVEHVGHIILDNLTSYSRTSTSSHYLPWKILTLISNLGLRPLFRFVCRFWAVNNTIKVQDINILTTHIGTENNLAAWFFLVCLSEFQDIKKPQFIMEYYLENVHGVTSADEYCSQFVMEALHLNWRRFEEGRKGELIDKLKDSIEKFNTPFPLIAKSIDICTLCDKDNAKTWASKLIHMADEQFKNSLDNLRSSEEQLCRYIFTLGEASLFCPKMIKKETIKTLMKILDPPDDEKKQYYVADVVKAVIVVTLGKLCLQDNLRSKSIVPLLGSLLEYQTSAPIKINILIVFTDLCIRYTSLIEPYLGDMCICLKDKDIKVRKLALKLISQLIQEEFIRLKCPVFFYLLCMLDDPESTIRDHAAAFIINSILSKYPKIMYQEFIQALFFYNDTVDTFSYYPVEVSDTEKQVFSMAGEIKKPDRRKLFSFMIEHMQDHHKFKITSAICTEILEKAAEGNISLDEKGSNLVSDALYAISCDEIKIQPKMRVEEGEEHDAVVGQLIQSNIISQLVKKNYVETALPTLMKLKQKLAKEKSPLLREILLALRDVLKQFKDEVGVMLSGDRQLAAEVALDLRNLEQQEAERDSGVIICKELRVTCEKLNSALIKNGRLMLSDFSIDDVSLSKPPSPKKSLSVIVSDNPPDNSEPMLSSPGPSGIQNSAGPSRLTATPSPSLGENHNLSSGKHSMDDDSPTPSLSPTPSNMSEDKRSTDNNGTVSTEKIVPPKQQKARKRKRN